MQPQCWLVCFVFVCFVVVFFHSTVVWLARAAAGWLRGGVLVLGTPSGGRCCALFWAASNPVCAAVELGELEASSSSLPVWILFVLPCSGARARRRVSSTSRICASNSESWTSALPLSVFEITFGMALHVRITAQHTPTASSVSVHACVDATVAVRCASSIGGLRLSSSQPIRSYPERRGKGREGPTQPARSRRPRPRHQLPRLGCWRRPSPGGRQGLRRSKNHSNSNKKAVVSTPT